MQRRELRGEATGRWRALDGFLERKPFSGLNIRRLSPEPSARERQIRVNIERGERFTRDESVPGRAAKPKSVEEARQCTFQQSDSRAKTAVRHDEGIARLDAF